MENMADDEFKTFRLSANLKTLHVANAIMSTLVWSQKNIPE